MLRVLGRITSINVRKVLWAADEMELPYEREDWGKPVRDPHTPEFLALNPNAQVPVIVDDGFVLWESNAIMRHLARRGGGGLIPADPHGEALMEQWLGWQATELNPSWSYAVRALARKDPGFDDPARIQASIVAWGETMQILEDQLKRTGAYAAGAVFTLADIAIGLSVHRWYRTPFTKPELPEVARYYGDLRIRPAAEPWLDDALF